MLQITMRLQEQIHKENYEAVNSLIEGKGAALNVDLARRVPMDPVASENVTSHSTSHGPAAVGFVVGRQKKLQDNHIQDNKLKHLFTLHLP